MAHQQNCPSTLLSDMASSPGRAKGKREEERAARTGEGSMSSMSSSCSLQLYPSASNFGK